MKKLLLTLIVSLAFCGSIFAQYESHWEFNFHDYQMQSGFVAGIQIDDHIIDLDDANWDALEIGFFVGDQCRGNDNYLFNSIDEYGDPYLTLDGVPVYYNISTVGETLTVKMYDHLNNIEYNEGVFMYMGSAITPLTGEDHYEGWDEPDNPIFLCFTTPGPATQTFTKEITGYGTSTGGYYLIASPVMEEIAPSPEDGFLTTAYDLYSFEPSMVDNEWQNYKAGAFDSLVNGKGYLYASQANTILTFRGTPYDVTEVVTLDLEYGTHQFNEWNLVGNPLSVAATIDRDFYTMNDERNDLIQGSGAIPAMEGVFVQATEDVQTVTFTPAVTGAKSNHSLALNLSQGTSVIDRAVVRFDESSMLPKFQLNPNHTKVYIPQDGKDYAVANAEDQGEMPVNFKAETSGTYTISFTADDVEFSYLHLIDNMTGNDVNLLENPSYSFDASATDYASRFKLVFAKGNANMGNDFGFFDANGNLMILGIDGTATLQMIDVTGRMISSETFSGNYSKAVNAKAGVYMLRLIQGNDVRTQKIVVK